MKIVIKASSIILLMAIFVHPQTKSRLRDHNFSGTAVLSAASIFTLGYNDYKDGKIGLGVAGMGEYFMPTYTPVIFGLRFIFGSQAIRGRDVLKTPDEFVTPIYILGGGLTFGYTFENKFFPYVYGGLSNLWFNPKDKNGKKLLNNSLGAYSRSAISYDIEIGSRLILQKKLSLFFGVGAHFVQTDNLDDLEQGKGKDFYYSAMIGVSFSFFGKSDADGDGIDDSDDPCPSNAEDYDGFQDEDGCPDYDNDKDKIPDVKDKCPNDPEDYDGFEDDDGCPDMDNDRDGIPDSLDACPNQPENFNGFQDKDGCPDILDRSLQILDNDNDGITNDVDKCPDSAETYNGFEDDDGCPDTVLTTDTISTKEIILEGSDLFEWRSSEIKPTALEKLNKTAEFLMNDPFVKWTVESYTDNNWDRDSLIFLSQQRAIALVRYFIEKELPSFMFKISAKGGESPIADNRFLEGRIKNNRIVLRRSE
jgi:outer membrane protein OmpA-like peptidoglycan-associated protein